MAISKKVRFEVFKRDSFTCQYCGKCAPDVVLNLDHIHPRARGGKDDILNLITSCYDCNQGKSDRELSDGTVIQKRKLQLDQLQERREQLDMMMAWQRGLADLEGEALSQLAEYWHDLVGWELNEAGLAQLRKLTRKFSIPELTHAMLAAVDQYSEADERGLTRESVMLAWSKVGAIAVVTRRCKDKPYLRDLYYIRGILRRRLNYVAEHEVMSLMEGAIESGASTDQLADFARTAGNWHTFRQWVYELDREM